MCSTLLLIASNSLLFVISKGSRKKPGRIPPGCSGTKKKSKNARIGQKKAQSEVFSFFHVKFRTIAKIL